MPFKRYNVEKGILMAFRVAAVFYLLGLLSSTHTRVYECPICHKIEEFAESSVQTHWCQGTPEKPHPKTSMTDKGERKPN